MKKLLVTGTSGFLGSRIVKFYKEKYHILAPTHAEMDITEENSVNLYFDQHKPDIVIHCAAISDTGTCENNPNLSRKVNVLGSENIAKSAAKHSAKCILCSSDQVYCGSTRTDTNCESDILTPHNVYGKDKAYAENSCLQLNPDSVHLRLAWMYDAYTPNILTHNDFISQIKNCVKNSEIFSLPINDKRGITDVWEVVKNMEKTFVLPGGVYNFGSPNEDNTYETAMSIFKSLHYDTSLLCQKEYTNARNLTMDQDKINSYGIFFSSTKDTIIRCLKKNKYIKRFDNSKLNIGTYYLAPYARTEAHVKDMANCGIDFVINIPNEPTILGLLSKYNIGAIVTNLLPNWFGGDGSNAGQMAEKNPIENYTEALNSYIDAPNILGIDTGDEPSALDFSHYGSVFNLIQQMVPHLQPYLNLYPNYALKGSNTPEEIKNQLQTNNYETYIETYCQNVNSDYICFDYYLYSASLDGLYQTLKTISSACRKYHRNLWMVLQVNSNQSDVWVSTNQLRFQAFSAMAFGAKNIIWACYTAGWWYNHVLDKEGNKTEQYDKLRQVNSEIHFLGSEYCKFNLVTTHFIGNFSVSTLESSTSFHSLFASNLHASNDEALVIGEMMSADGRNALFICASNDPSGQALSPFQISFHSFGYQVELLLNETRTLLASDEAGYYAFDIHPCEGALLIFTPTHGND